ncbi:uncharacterized protein LOC117341440 [Pecten maximus]|nr:uncharacterized protein LOC117341440 [Pecten maximus]
MLRDLNVNERRHLILATDHQLSLLAKTKTWYMDATFHVVKHPFTQLFSIHGFIRSGSSMKQIPLAFCFMSGKRTEDYYEVLRSIDRQLPDEIRLELCVVDFEAAVWQAIRQRYPDCRIQGCAFHWSQAVFRKVQELGLQTAYNERGDVYDFIRQVMCLPFLPSEQIVETFMRLDDRVTSPA